MGRMSAEWDIDGEGMGEGGMSRGGIDGGRDVRRGGRTKGGGGRREVAAVTKS